MKIFQNSETTRVVRRLGMTACLCHNIPLDAVIEAIRTPGETLKLSKKSRTRRVGEWVIKESRPEAGLGLLKHTFLRRRYRRAWVAANHLARYGVHVPAPLAFIEKGLLGIIAGNVLVSEYLDGFSSVEQYAARLAARNAEEVDIGRFLSRLADAVTQLCESGAYHSDLSGKNIFTCDGFSFYFIDLDGVFLDVPYTEELRMKNHVQLYDSFCDLFDDRLMVPFLARMMPRDFQSKTWLPAIRKAQRQRRARTETIWLRQNRRNKSGSNTY